MTVAARQTWKAGQGESKRFKPPAIQWIVNAWHRLGWQHVLLAILFEFVAVAFGPFGGAWLHIGRSAPDDPILEVVSGRWIVNILPLIVAAIVADEACDSGVRPFVAYGSAMAISAIVLPILDPAFARLVGLPYRSNLFNSFLFIQLILVGGLFIAGWGYWHVTRRAMESAQTAEAERALDQQRLVNARLLTLQARVEPQFLFDVLSKVNELHSSDARVADALLTDMISLLRAMLPVTSVVTSTVEHEFSLARAWCRVQSQLGGGLHFDIAAVDEAASVEVGPMLVVPMLRAAIGASPANMGPWRLAADCSLEHSVTSGRRLRISLTSAAEGSDAINLGLSIELEALQKRVALLYGDGGTLSWATSADRASLVLDVPAIVESAP